MSTHDSVPDTSGSHDWIEAFVDPQTIAIIGASNDPTKISGRPLEYLNRFGFAGRVIPINPRRDTVQGIPSHPSLDAVEGHIDLAMILTDAKSSVEALRACAERGVSNAILVAAGFAEVGPEGLELQAQLEQIVAESGMRIIGPNCTGVISTLNAVVTTFSTSLDREMLDERLLRDGEVGFVSQSGGVGGVIRATGQRRGLGFSQYFTTGNEVDLSVSEILQALADREEVSMLMAYFESIGDGNALVQAAVRASEADKPLVVLKAGRSKRGAAAVSSHTGALAGPAEAFDAVINQYGAIQAESLDQFVDYSVMFSSGRRMRGRRMTIVSMSGGMAVLGTDAGEKYGLEVEPWSEAWKARMTEVIPAYGSATNPIDLTASLIGDPEMLGRVLRVASEHPESDCIVIMIGNSDKGSEGLISEIVSAYQNAELPIAVVWAGGSGRPRTLLADAGVPCYEDPYTAVEALSALADWSLRPTSHGSPPEAADSSKARRIIKSARLQGQGTQLNEYEAAQLFAAYGIQSMPSELVSTSEECVAAAERLGEEVVVKLVSSKIAHKSDIGGVFVGPKTPDDIRAAGRDVLAAAERNGVSDAKILVQAKAEPGLELVLGVKRDPVFGPMVVVGLGGTLVEVIEDFQMLHAPVSVEQANAALSKLKAARLFDGVRGSESVSQDAAAEVLAKLSVLAADLDEMILELDINPLIIHRHDAVAVDGLVVLSDHSID